MKHNSKCSENGLIQAFLMMNLFNSDFDDPMVTYIMVKQFGIWPLLLLKSQKKESLDGSVGYATTKVQSSVDKTQKSSNSRKKKAVEG
ncbi:MAG: hypothetical protein AAF502_23330 [Bacteroidota bacterium]